MFQVPTVEKRLIVSFLLHYDLTQLLTRKQFILCISWTVNQLISRVEKYNIFPEGFVTNIPVLAYVGEPLEINRNAFGCHVCVSPVPF